MSWEVNPLHAASITGAHYGNSLGSFRNAMCGQYGREGLRGEAVPQEPNEGGKGRMP